MYNKIILSGNLSRDIELKYTAGGMAIANTAIATSRKFKGQDGQQKEEVLFVDITFFGRTAEVANQYLRKGSKVLVDGRLKLDQWTAQDGTKRSKHSVTVESLQMIGSKGDNEDASTDGYNTPPVQPQNNYSQSVPTQPTQQQQMQQMQQSVPQQPSSIFPEIDINEDEIPF